MISLLKKRTTLNVLKFLGWFFLLLPVIYLTVFKFYFLRMISNGDTLEKILLGNGLVFVSIEEVRGGWVDYDPKITISEGKARLTSGVVVSLDRLDLRFDSLGTLLERSPVFSTAEVEGLSVNYEISSNTEFSLGSNKLAPFPNNYFSNIFKALDHLTVNNVSFEVNRSSDSWKIKNQPDRPWILEKAERTSNFSLPLTIERWTEGIKSSSTDTHLKGSFSDHHDDPSFSVSAQFGLVGLEVEPFSDLVEKYQFMPIGGAINSQLWFSRRFDEFDISASVEIDDAVFPNSVSLEEISGRARYVGKSLTNGSLKIEDIVVKNTEKVFEISDLELLLDRNYDRGSAALFLPLASLKMDKLH